MGHIRYSPGDFCSPKKGSPKKRADRYFTLSDERNRNLNGRPSELLGP